MIQDILQVSILTQSEIRKWYLRDHAHLIPAATCIIPYP